MKSIVLYFHVHQPYRLCPFDIFSIGETQSYFETDFEKTDNQRILKKVAAKCYTPTNRLLLKLIKKHPDFRVSFSISGVVIDQLEAYAPEVLDSFKALVATGNVELINETYYHSLSFLYSKKEFVDQINQHTQKISEVFGVTPKAFRNTELIYSNDIAAIAQELGFKTILAEGVDRYLDGRSPNRVYTPKDAPSMRLLLKNYQLSDDIAFRFSDKQWSQWPVTAPEFMTWISQALTDNHLINLFMDYETFGEHQWEDSGIFKFMEHIPDQAEKVGIGFDTISQAAWKYPSSGVVDMPELTSWADTERDLSAWISNPMQQEALRSLFALKSQVADTRSKQLTQAWRRLTTSDHFYYMCTKWFADGDVHTYFSPYDSPYEAFTNYMNVLHDLRIKLEDRQKHYD